MSQCRNAWRIVGTLGLLVGLAACEGVPGHYPGGNIASIDKYTYPSTSYLPQTVSVVDTRTGQAIWSKDIPVGQQLVMRFYADKGDDPSNPDRLDWQIMAIGAGGQMSHSIYVPNAASRRIDTAFRAPGELAPVAGAAEPTPPAEVPAAPAPAPEATPAEAPPAATGEGASDDGAPIDLPDSH